MTTTSNSPTTRRCMWTIRRQTGSAMTGMWRNERCESPALADGTDLDQYCEKHAAVYARREARDEARRSAR